MPARLLKSTGSIPSFEVQYNGVLVRSFMSRAKAQAHLEWLERQPHRGSLAIVETVAQTFALPAGTL